MFAHLLLVENLDRLRRRQDEHERNELCDRSRETTSARPADEFLHELIPEGLRSVSGFRAADHENIVTIDRSDLLDHR